MTVRSRSDRWPTIGATMTSIVSSCIALIATAAAAPPVVHQAQHSVEPMTLFQNDKLTACGVRAVFDGPAGGSFALLLVRLDDPNGSEWSVSFKPTDSQDQGAETVSLETDGLTTATLFKPTTPAVPGTVETRGALDETTGTRLIIGLMIGGGTFTVTDRSGASSAFAVPGPLPHEVRSGYLTCAGDLFRP
jgi:hypothetical protein